MKSLEEIQKLKIKNANRNLKLLKVDKSKWYTFVVITNTPQKIDFSKCEHIDGLLVEEGAKFIK